MNRARSGVERPSPIAVAQHDVPASAPASLEASSASTSADLAVPPHLVGVCVDAVAKIQGIVRTVPAMLALDDIGERDLVISELMRRVEELSDALIYVFDPAWRVGAAEIERLVHGLPAAAGRVEVTSHG